MLQEYRPGRGVVPRNVPEYQVIRADGSLYVTGSWTSVFVQARARLLCRNLEGAELWYMVHTPWTDMPRFNASQKELFEQSRCSCIVIRNTSLKDPRRYCGEPSAPKADRGYCKTHKGK